MRGKCGTCAFQVHNECRRRPPVDGWPDVLDADWCGEYRPLDMVKHGYVRTDVEVLGDDLWKALNEVVETLNVIDDTLRAFPK